MQDHKCRLSTTYSLCAWVQPANTPYARRPFHSRKPPASIAKSWLTGHGLQAETWHPLSSTCHSAWGGLGLGSAVQRYAAAPRTAWKTVIPTLMSATDLTDMDSLFAPTPTLRGQQSTLAHQMNKPALLLKPLGAALRTHQTQKTLVNATQRTTHKQIMETFNDNPHPKSDPHFSNGQKIQALTFSSPTARHMKRTTDASKSLWPDDLC